MAAKYRLEALLRVKQREKKKAELFLARRLAEWQKAKEKLEELKKQKEAILEKTKSARARMDREMTGGGRIQSGCFHVNFLRKLKEDREAKEAEIETQKEAVAICQENVVKARRDYFEAIRQLRVMEQHKALWKKRQERVLRLKEEKEMDELGRTIYSLRKWRGERSEFQLE